MEYLGGDQAAIGRGEGRGAKGGTAIAVAMLAIENPMISEQGCDNGLVEQIGRVGHTGSFRMGKQLHRMLCSGRSR